MNFTFLTIKDTNPQKQNDKKRSKRILCYISITKNEIAMISSSEVINLIKGFSLTERLMIVEEILRNIREENVARGGIDSSKTENVEPEILSLAGIIDEEEAKVLNSAVEESRKIDKDEW